MEVNLANRARDKWRYEPIVSLSPARPSWRPLTSYARCPDHRLFLQEFGWAGRYVCPLCLACQWFQVHESDHASQSAFVDMKLYGRLTRERERHTSPDLRPVSAYTWKTLRGKLRRFAFHTMHIPGAQRMELEQLARLVGNGPQQVLDSLSRVGRIKTQYPRGANAL